MRLVSPTSVNVFGRMLVAVVVVGSLAAFANVTVGVIHAALTGQTTLQHDVEVLNDPKVSLDIYTPVEQRIANREDILRRLQSKAAIKSQEKVLAGLFEEQGHKAEASGDWTRAEDSYYTASNLDRDSAQYARDIAQLYANAAVKQNDSSHRQDLWRSSSQYWDNALTLAHDSSLKRSFSTEAATVAFNWANDLKSQGRLPEALNKLQRAKAMVPPNTQLSQQIDFLIEQVRN